MTRRDRAPHGGARYGGAAREPVAPSGDRPVSPGGDRPPAGAGGRPAYPPELPGRPPRDTAGLTLRDRLATATVPAVALVPMRFFFGATFLYAGLDKVLDPTFFDAASPTSIQAQLTAFARVSPIAPIIRAGEPFAVWLGILIAIAEIAIGLGALTGLAFRLAAVGGAALSLLFWLTASWATHPYYYGPDLPYAAGWLVLALAGHGGLLVPRQVLALEGGGIPASVRGYARSGGRAGAARVRSRQADAGQVASPERRALVQLAVLGSAALAVGAIAAPLRLLRPSGTASSGGPGAGGGLAGGGTGATGASPTPGASSGATPGPTGPAATANARLAIAKTADVDQAGGFAFTVPLDAPAPLPAGDPGVVVKLASGSYVAYDAVCTHQGCTVEWDAADGVLLCPCHGAAFDAAQRARVLQGPARQPLASLPIKVDAATGQIVLTA